MKLASFLYNTTEIRFVHIYNSQKLKMEIEAQISSARKLGGPLNISERKIYTSRSIVRTFTLTELRSSYLPNALHYTFGIFVRLAACKCTPSGMTRVWNNAQQRK